MSSSPVTAGGGAASEHDGAAGLREPLLANGVHDGRFHDGTLAAVVVANYAHGGGSRAKEKHAVKAKDGYWVDVHHQPPVADVESGGGDRPLLFSNKKVMAALLYPYRDGRTGSRAVFAAALLYSLSAAPERNYNCSSPLLLFSSPAVCSTTWPVVTFQVSTSVFIIRLMSTEGHLQIFSFADPDATTPENKEMDSWPASRWQVMAAAAAVRRGVRLRWRALATGLPASWGLRRSVPQRRAGAALALLPGACARRPLVCRPSPAVRDYERPLVCKPSPAVRENPSHFARRPWVLAPIDRWATWIQGFER